MVLYLRDPVGRPFRSSFLPMPTFRRIALSAAATLVAASVAASTLLAQAAATAPVRKTAITLNPIALVAGFLTGDVETHVAPAITLGVGGSAALIDEYTGYRSLDVKIRYYPNERPLEGFAVAGSLGVASAREQIYTYTTTTTITTSSSAPPYQRQTRATFGTELSYQWLLGPRKRFITVIGFGVKRVLGDEAYVEPINNSFLPTARANIGFAF